MATTITHYFRKNPAIFLGALCLSGALFLDSAGKQALASVKNGFDLSDALIPHHQIFQGGPPKDGIPSIDNPKFVTPQAADFLKPTDRVIGIVVENQARAYPIPILNWHEVVNDQAGTTSFVVTYCPLCGTGMVFLSDLGDRKPLSFGVSGLLYNSDVLLYDRQTESLWSQVMGQAVTGAHQGKRLKLLPAMHTTWENWVKRHPQSLVLSRDTGTLRDYDRNPYEGYEESARTFFPLTNQAPAVYHPKERVLGMTVKGAFKAYPFVELSKNGKNRFRDSIAGVPFEIFWDEKSSTAWVQDAKGREYAATIAFWFAWYAFHPGTMLFKAP